MHGITTDIFSFKQKLMGAMGDFTARTLYPFASFAVSPKRKSDTSFNFKSTWSGHAPPNKVQFLNAPIDCETERSYFLEVYCNISCHGWTGEVDVIRTHDGERVLTNKGASRGGR